MFTLLWIIIAYALRKKYLPEEANWVAGLVYYIASSMFTPIIGIPLFRWMLRNGVFAVDYDDDGTNGCCYLPDF